MGIVPKKVMKFGGIYLILVFFLFLFVNASFAKFRFAVMADSRKSASEPVNIEEFQKVLAQMKRVEPQPEFCFFPGDLVRGFDTTYTTMTNQFTIWKNAVTPFYPITFFYPGVGNHETGDGNPKSQAERAFHDVFSQFTVTEELPGYNRTVYYLDHDQCRFFMLNSNHIGEDNKVDAVQREWLSRNLVGKTHYFVFVHEPAYPISSHIGDSLDAHTTDRDAFWKIVDQANVSLVFVGHEHFYARRHIDKAFNPEYKNNIYQVITGTCGASPYTAIALGMLNSLDANKKFLRTTNIDVEPKSVYHFAIVDVDGEKVTTTVYDVTGKIIDQFEITRPILKEK